MWEEVQPKSDLWNWDENPILEGMLIAKEPKTNKEGRGFWIYTIAQEVNGEFEDGNDIKILGSKIIDARLTNCELGTRVKITFLENRISGGGNPYRMFKIEKWKDTGEKNNVVNGGIDMSSALEEQEKIDVEDIPF